MNKVSHNKISKTGLFVFLFSAFLLLFSEGKALASLERNVLIVHSYHVGYKWTDDIANGIMEGLSPDVNEISLHIEYLDMKRYYSDERYYQTALWLGQKYLKTPIDLIITTDDAALIFMKEFGATLFPGIPVFFCGTNYLEEEDIKGFDNFYGVTERADIAETIRVILDVIPDTRHIYIVNDTTVTGQKVHAEIVDAIGTYRDKVDFTFLEDYSMGNLITKVSNLPENSVIFYTFFFRDNTAMTFEYDQSMRLISRQSNRPMFGAWDFNLGLGIIGGMLTSGRQQGIAVAELALSRLNGTPLEQLPRVTSSPNRFMFDYQQIKRHGLSLGAFPDDSIIINSPDDFIQKHRNVLIGSAFISGFLLFVIIAMSINIHRRRMAEKELLQSEKNFRDIFNNAGEGLYQSTESGRFIRVNPAMARILKCSSPEDVLAHYTDISKTLYSSQDYRDRLINRKDEKDWEESEVTITRKDGTEIKVLEKMHAVHNGKGEFLYFEGSVVDLTEYKRTQELITQTDKMLSLGGVSAGIAHEIRSPLSTISLGSQVIAGRLLDDNPTNRDVAEQCSIDMAHIREYARKRELDKMLNDIHESSLRAGIIMDDMLSYSKKTIGEFEHASLEKIIKKAIVLAQRDYNLRRECQFDTIRIKEDFPGDIPDVFCSPSKIQQVIFNILKNGAEAMAEAKTPDKRFTIRLIDEQKNARIEIADNGPGIDADVRKKVFQPFFTTKGKDKGTGLGLSVSTFIVNENHNGELLIDSTPGLGTTFIIRLPYGPPA